MGDRATPPGGAGDPGGGGDDPRKNKKRVVIDGVVEEVEASGEDSEDDLSHQPVRGRPEKKNDPQLEVLVGLTKSVGKMASGFTEMVKRDPLKEVLGAPTAGTFGQGGKVQGLFSKELLRKSLNDNPRPIWQEMEARLREHLQRHDEPFLPLLRRYEKSRRLGGCRTASS